METTIAPQVASIRWQKKLSNFAGRSSQGVDYYVAEVVAEGWAILYLQDATRWVRIPLSGLKTAGQARTAALDHAAATLAESL